MRTFTRCPLFPHTFASSAATCSNERAGHTGHPLFPSTRCCHSFFLPSSTPTLFISSLLGSDLHICARWSTPFKFFETRSLLHAFPFMQLSSPFNTAFMIKVMRLSIVSLWDGNVIMITLLAILMETSSSGIQRASHASCSQKYVYFSWPGPIVVDPHWPDSSHGYPTNTMSWCISTASTGIMHSSRCITRSTHLGNCLSTLTASGSSTYRCFGSIPLTTPQLYASQSVATRPLWPGPQWHLGLLLQPLSWMSQHMPSFHTFPQPGTTHCISPIGCFSSSSH